MEQNLYDQVQILTREVERLKVRRVTQDMIPPDTIKQRHIGEGIRFIRSGLEADLPTTGEPVLTGTAIYFAYDTNKLYVWNQSTNTWKSTTLT